jgi:hypothetical protein
MDTIWNWLTENSDAATAIGTIFSAFTALIALFLSAYGLRAQRRHDVLSARPLPEVTVADYENSLRVKLRNNGVGPMMVKSVKVIRDGATRDSLIAWMPELPGGRLWNHFATDLADRSLPPDGAVPLLELSQLEGENEFASCRDRVRRSLKDLAVQVEYSDAYGTEFPPYRKSLEWFGRNLREHS